MNKLLLIFNPNTSGNRLKNKLLEMLCRFSEAGYELHVHPTASNGDARRIAKEHAAGYDLVVCCGGDGTLNEVVDGLMCHSERPILGYVPCGTTNDYAASLKLPRSNIMAAVERVIHPRKVFQCDVGCFNERSFNYVAAFGAFTDVAYKTPQNNKNILGYFAYVLEAVQRLPSLHPMHARFKCGEKEYEGDYLFGVVANSASVAGFTFPDKAKVQLDDGMFEMLLVHHPHNIAEIGGASAALLRGDISSPLLTVARVSEVEFFAEEPCAWTLDGEYGGKMSHARISVQNKALRICV